MTITAVTQLRAIREQWGDLLTAISRPPTQEWPPRETAGFLNHADDDPADRPTIGRLPLVLRQHPAPANLVALDAALDIERALFDLADRIAAAVQRPITPGDYRVDRGNNHHADRWHLPAHRTATLITGAGIAEPGSRRLGLHWCARWIEDRLTATELTDLHAVVRGVLREHAEQVVARAHARLTRALARDPRAITLPDPCPWCTGELTGHTEPDKPPYVTCDTGPTCTAPTVYDSEARRVWRGPDMVSLYVAMQAARARAAA